MLFLALVMRVSCMQGIDKYIDVLAREADRDMAVFHNAWVVYTVFPICLYIGYAILKWYILLMPITLPLTILVGGRSNKFIHHKNN
jgi:hypothetical protein